jgi:hypothetical protein
MAAHLGNRGVIDGDTDIINPGASGSRNFPCRSNQPIADTRPDEGDVTLRRDRASLWELQAAGRSASKKIKPPWAMP